jgi:hypothetical protein
MCRQLGVFDDKGGTSIDSRFTQVSLKTDCNNFVLPGPTEEWGHYDLELPQLVARLPSALLGSLTEFFGTHALSRIGLKTFTRMTGEQFIDPAFVSVWCMLAYNVAMLNV